MTIKEIQYRIKTWSTIVIIIIITLFYCSLCFASEEYEFAKAAIRSFQCNKIANEKSALYLNRESDNHYHSLYNTMAGSRAAISWHEKALLEIKPYSKSNKDIIKLAATAFVTGNKALIDVLNENIIMIEQFMNKKPNEIINEIGTIFNKLSELNELSNNAWELLMMGAIGVCNAMVQMDKKGTLAITTKEKQNLLKELRNIGISSGPKAGQKPVEFAPSTIWKFLSEKGWKTIDSPQLK